MEIRLMIDDDMQIQGNVGLEATVARHDAVLDAMERNISSLTNVVRSQGDRMEAHYQRVDDQLQKLIVASAPKGVDRTLLVSVISIVIAGLGLGILIGSATLAPMSASIRELKEKQDDIVTHLRSHELLELHPVGKAQVQKLSQEIEAFRVEGTPMMREKIAVIEEKLNRDGRKQP
jgi:hypothetical protein